MPKSRLAAHVLLGLLGWTLAASCGRAELPVSQLTSVFPPGCRQASVVEVEIAGTDLTGVDRLVFSHPGIKAELKRGNPPVAGLPAPAIANRFVVSVAADVPAGLYDVRAVGHFGISNPRAFAVDRLAELNEETTNTSFDKAMRVPLESVVNGRTAAGAVDYFRFAARKGQRVLIELFAERIDSRLDGTLSLAGPTGRELGHSRDSIGRDPMIDVEIPADGDYTVAVYDSTYRGGADSFYRLKLHTGPHVDFIFPPCGQPGTSARVTVFGRNLPGASKSSLRVEGRPLEQLPATIEFPGSSAAQQLAFAGYLPSESASLDAFAFRLPTSAGPANDYLLSYASVPVVLEQEPNDRPDKPQSVKLPCELTGWFSGPDDVDWYEFEAKAGQVYWFDLISRRRGEASDPDLLIQRVVPGADGKAQYKDVAETDDVAASVKLPGFVLGSADPTYRFAVPADGKYCVLVHDLAGSASPRPYTLAIRPPQPDFRLVAVAVDSADKEVKPWSLLVRRGGTAMLEVVALRRDGFDGAIDASVAGLPDGIKARPITIAAGQQSGQLVFECAANQPSWAGTIEVLGTAMIDGQKAVRHARSGTAVSTDNSTKKAKANMIAGRMAHAIALAATADESMPVKVAVAGPETVELSRAGKLQLPINVVRSGFTDALSLVPQELPGVRKPTPVAIAAGKTEGQLVADIPATTAVGEYSIILRGEAKIEYRRDLAGLHEAQQNVAQVEKLLAEAKTKAKSAKPDAAKRIEADIRALEGAKAAADKRLADATKTAQPKPETVVLVSAPVRLKITAAPVDIEIKAPPPSARPAELKVPIALQRRYNYAEQVAIDAVPGPQVPDVQISPLVIPAGKSEGTLLITVRPKAPAGTHRLMVRARLKLNGQALETDAAFTITLK